MHIGRFVQRFFWGLILLTDLLQFTSLIKNVFMIDAATRVIKKLFVKCYGEQ